jgi:hypothetical protein
MKKSEAPKLRTINSTRMIDRVMKWSPTGKAEGVKAGYAVNVWHYVNGWFASVTRPPRVPGGPPHMIYNEGHDRETLKRWATEKYIECIKEDAK